MFKKILIACLSLLVLGGCRETKVSEPVNQSPADADIVSVIDSAVDYASNKEEVAETIKENLQNGFEQGQKFVVSEKSVTLN